MMQILWAALQMVYRFVLLSKCMPKYASVKIYIIYTLVGNSSSAIPANKENDTWICPCIWDTEILCVKKKN